ncbi:MAG: diguanylate cyclase [Clostridia bacterium]|nr:diguanylate cyclase [Clostridia bacterium]
MKVLRTIRDYYFYCGIGKEEYNAVKKEAYISNFKVWKILHFLMAAIFGLLFIGSFLNRLMSMNRWFYLTAFLYSLITIVVFMKIKKDSMAAQLLIYLSMSVLFLFAAFISQNKPEYNATTFVVLLVVTPMFMIDKPYFMTIELSVATAIFLIWMRVVKPETVWQVDMVNSITFTVVGSFLNIIANSLRIREFVLTRQIRIQKDTDEMTGLRNKDSLTREINEYLADASTDKGLLFIMDLDRFKSINDTYGHDVGDSVIVQLGGFLAGRFTGDEIVGRFGGDEFILFIKDTDDTDTACKIAGGIAKGVTESVKLPDEDNKLSISIGIALYKGREKYYSELFKKADIALYNAKRSPNERFCVYD